jgi:hypothetical protein
MSTVLDIINDALRIVGAQQNGETLDSNAANAALRSLNRMLGAWDTERLLVYTINPIVINLVGNQQDYTCGPTGTAYPERFTRIEEAYIRVTSGTQPYDRPLRLVYDEGWSAIGVKTVSSPVPTILYNQGGYPDITLRLWPIPTVVYEMVVYVWNQLTNFANIDDSFGFPPGYEDAIVYNLAARLAPEYGMALDDFSLAQANLSKMRLYTMNSSPIYLPSDSALLFASKRRGFNYLTGNFGKN